MEKESRAGRDGRHRGHRGAEQDSRTAVNLKNFLKGKERVKKVAGLVADHYRENIEPLAIRRSRGLDREACAFYKERWMRFCPAYSEIVFTNNNDPAH